MNLGTVNGTSQIATPPAPPRIKSLDSASRSRAGRLSLSVLRELFRLKGEGERETNRAGESTLPAAACCSPDELDHCSPGRSVGSNRDGKGR